MDLHVVNLQARQSEVVRLIDGLLSAAVSEPAPRPYPVSLLARLACAAGESSCHIQELVTVVVPSFDPSLAAHLLALTRRLSALCSGLVAAAQLADLERAANVR